MRLDVAYIIVLSLMAWSATQADVWEHVAPLIRSCADGFNACIFAYGQTGSGKPPRPNRMLWSCIGINLPTQAAQVSIYFLTFLHRSPHQITVANCNLP